MAPIFPCLRGISAFLPARILTTSSKSAVKKRKKSWGYLPVEIRKLILDVLTQDGCSLANLATVSREWQTTIEKHNFSRIRVTPSRLPELNSMTSRNRSLVRYIWVCLELGEYPCPEHNHPALLAFEDTLAMDNVIVTTGLRDLFEALSKWEPRRGELLLDVSFYSPSDSKYWFKELTFVPDFPSADECDRALGGAAKARLASRIDGDKQHGWTRGAPPRLAIDTAFPRMLWWEPFGHPQEQVDWWRQLPEAPVVTGLLLRQQNRRRIFPWTVSMMMRLLPRVGDVYFEPWREWNDNIQLFDDIVYRDALNFSRLDIDPERLVLFENSDQRYLPSLPPCELLRTADPFVAESVARTSLGVRHLSAAFMVDAGDFLASAIGHPTWRWPELTSLALTSRVLAPEAQQYSVAGMLITAAAVARRMPALETVEIWNGREGLAGLFRFRSALRGRTAGISWRGTWNLALGKDVIQAWEAIANRHRRAELVVVNEEVLDARKIRFHGDAIHHLGIEAQVVRPVSLYQMRMERDVREAVA